MASVAVAQRPHLVRALYNRSFALLWLGQSISIIGDLAFATALAWQVLALTGSAATMGLVEVCWSTPLLVTLLFGGVLADRVSPRAVMLASDSLRGLVVLTLAILAWTHHLQLWQLIVLALIFGSVDGFFYPAYGKMPPTLLERDDLTSGNALTQLTRQITGMAGPLVGAGAIALIGLPFSFAFDGVTFVASVLCLLAIRMPHVEIAAAPADSSADEQPGVLISVWLDIQGGFSVVKTSTWLWASILVAAVVNMGFLGPRIVAMPKLVTHDYHSGVWLLGALVTGGTLGGIVGTLLMGHIHTIHRRGLVAYGALLVSSAALIGFALPLPLEWRPAVATISNAFVGFGVSIYGVIWTTLLQELVPRDKLGRVGSLDMLGSLGLQPVAFALAGILADRFSPSAVFAAAGVMNCAASLFALSIRAIRQMD